MDWKVHLKSNPVVAGLIGVVAFITAIGTLAGAVNSIFEFAGQDVFKGSDSWFVRTYFKLTGWLSTEVVFSVWAVLPVLAVVAITVAYLLSQRTRLKTLSAELELLRNPPRPTIPQLDSTDERVLFWVKHIYDSRATGMGPTPANVASASEITLTTVETALDVLKKSGLVRLQKLKSAPIDLTSDARGYLKKPDVMSRYGAFEFNLAHRRI
ncbi:hypothetical protein [Pseudomonas sp. URMO17WK12:I11]|uniref:hypothetical protein n=1 Tax=Pseudomonas sp. URMO17WK12:I11 TaxID=1283291 RepID=UPI00071F605A|nr:hypothetical protein [Pseudomonas sp. URMO17WK12:I11]CRL48352.1 hypothetical protein PSHI_14060 [Pseudomonas sp. URMO17WK12:I11]